MQEAIRGGLGLLGGTLRDLAPILLIVAFFQFAVLRQPVHNLADIAVGFVFVMLGLAIFIRGLEMALFPLGEALAHAFARKGSLFWLLSFAFGLGFGTTVAEPALIAVSGEAKYPPPRNTRYSPDMGGSTRTGLVDSKSR